MSTSLSPAAGLPAAQVTSDQVARYSGILGRPLVWFVPVFMVLQAIVYGGLVPSQQAGTFPIIPLAGFRIRIEEVLILAGFVGWLVTWCLAQATHLWAGRPLAARVRPTLVGLLVVWTALGLAQAAVRGILAGNYNSLLDTRIVAIPLLYFTLVLFWIHRVRLAALEQTLYRVLVALMVVATLSIFLPVTEVMTQLLQSIGGIYGGYATPVETLVVFGYCLVWARLLTAPRFNGQMALLLLFVMAGLAARLGKTNWVYLVEVPALMLLTTSYRRVLAGWRGAVRKRWVVVLALAVAGLLVALAVLVLFQPALLDQFVERSLVRILRPDAGGDISGGRFKIMADGWRKLWEAPVFGSGFGFWYAHMFRGQLLYMVPDHFSPLWLSTRAGLFTFGPALMLCVWYLWAGLRALGRVGNPSLKPLVLACYVFSVTMLVYSLYGVPQNLLEPQIFFWLSVGVVLKAARHPENVAGAAARAAPAGAT